MADIADVLGVDTPVETEVEVADVDTDVADTDTDVDASADADADAADTDTDPDAATTDDDAAKASKVEDKSGKVSEAKVTQYLKELATKDPAAAKFMRHEIFENKNFKTVYPTVADAIAAKEREMQFDTVEATSADGDSLTGAEAALQIVTDMQKMDSGLAAGERWAIEGIAEQFKDGFVKLVPEALELMLEKDKPAYNRMMANVITNTFQSVGFTKILEEAFSLLQAGKGPEAAEKMERLHAWVQGVKESAAAGAKEEISPELKQAREQLKSVASEKQTNFVSSVSSKITNQSNVILEREINSVFKGMNLSDAQKRRIVQNVNDDIAANLKKDKKFQSAKGTFLKHGGNETKSVDFFMARMTREIPEAVLKVKSELYGTASTRKAGSTATKTAAAAKDTGELPALTSMPTKDKIDWDKTNQDGVWNAGRVHLIGEKKPRVLKFKK